MKILFVVILVASTLAGCALLPQATNNVATEFPEPQVSTDNSGIVTSQTPDATPSQNPETPDIQWELNPGLKLKLDQLTSDKDCAGLNRIFEEFVGRTETLDDYMKKSLSASGCEMTKD